MNKGELKMIVSNHFNKLIGEWFDTNSIQDNLAKTFAKTILQANINKYDNIIDLVTDENGDVLINELIDNIPFEDIKIDLTTFNIPLLPRKILIFSKQDFERIKQEIKKG